MKLLVVIDMQKDFIDGVLGTSEAKNIVPKVKEKIRTYVESGDPIVFTRDTHYENYLETQEGRNLPVPHCIEGTEGWDIHPDLEILNEEFNIINKETFGYTDWAPRLFRLFNYRTSEDIESIELVGLCTDICVISNAMILKAIFPEIPVIVDASCCAGVTPESHKIALDAMKMCQIKIINE